MDTLSTFLISITTTCSFMAPGAGGGQGPQMAQQPVYTLQMNVNSCKPAEWDALATSCLLPDALKIKSPIAFMVPERPKPSSGGSGPRLAPSPGLGGVEREWRRVDMEYWGSSKAVETAQPDIRESRSQPKAENPEPKPEEVKPQPPPQTEAPKPPDRCDSPYASWSANSRKDIKGGASCVGTYNLTSRFAGDTSVALTSSQDFLAPVEIIKPGKVNFEKKIDIEWKPVERAVGYFVEARASLSITGLTREDNKSIRWTSSRQKNAPYGLEGRVLTPKELGAYMGGEVFLPNTTTKCTIPAGVFKGMDTVDLTIIAIGNDLITKKGDVETRVLVRSTARMSLRKNVEANAITDEEESENAATDETAPAENTGEDAPQQDQPVAY